MSIFEMLPKKLIAVYHEQDSEDIDGNIFTWFETSNGGFGFRFMRDYSGKVSSEGRRGNVNRQQGLFDIQVVTGNKIWKENYRSCVQLPEAPEEYLDELCEFYFQGCIDVQVCVVRP